MRVLLPLFILVPVVEIGLFFLSGKYLGVLPTLLIIVLTGFFGARLAKREGLHVYRKANEQLKSGNLPGSEIIEGLCILIGGILLLTPGYLTDVTGLILLLPGFRKRVVVRQVRKFLENKLAKGDFTIYYKK